MRVVIALGGNAILQRGQPLEADVQRANIRAAAGALAEIAHQHQVVVTHGNGPQVGLLTLQAEAYRAVRPYSLDVLGAESEGMIGYMIEQELSNALPERQCAALLTQVEVDMDDPAFHAPSKPIGPVYEQAEAERLERDRGWSIAADGDAFRRVVPSPEPRRIVELKTIELLLEAGHIVVCAGGGGIPVVRGDDGYLHGVEAVIDKDRAAALLADQIGAERLLLLTDVPAVWADWPEPAEKAIRAASPDAMQAFQFDVGSMGPKVEAACRFARSGKVAVIGALSEARALLDGNAGTSVSAAADALEYYDPAAVETLRAALADRRSL